MNALQPKEELGGEKEDDCQGEAKDPEDGAPLLRSDLRSQEGEVEKEEVAGRLR